MQTKSVTSFLTSHPCFQKERILNTITLIALGVLLACIITAVCRLHPTSNLRRATLFSCPILVAAIVILRMGCYYGCSKKEPPKTVPSPNRDILPNNSHLTGDVNNANSEEKTRKNSDVLENLDMSLKTEVVQESKNVDVPSIKLEEFSSMSPVLYASHYTSHTVIHDEYINFFDCFLITPSVFQRNLTFVLNDLEVIARSGLFNGEYKKYCRITGRGGSYDNKDDKGKEFAQRLALLSAAMQLFNHPPPPETAEKVSVLLQNPYLPLVLAFPLQRLLLSCHNQNNECRIKIVGGFHYLSRKDMSRAFEVSAEEKELAIQASDAIEGYDFGMHGLRIAVHQRPGPRTNALIRAHIKEFLSGRRNFYFERTNLEYPSFENAIPELQTNELLRYHMQRISASEKRDVGHYHRAVANVVNQYAPNEQKQVIVEKVNEFFTPLYGSFYTNNMKNGCTVMLYILNSLKEGRRTYYARRPEYLDSERLTAALVKYETSPKHLKTGAGAPKYAFSSYQEYGEERYIFEAAAQHLEKMREAIMNCSNLETFQNIASEFRDHYSIVYKHLPTFSLSIAATIHPDVISESSIRQSFFLEKGVVPEVLLELQQRYPDHTLIAKQFHKLSDHFKEIPEFGHLVEQLENAVVQVEYYTEADPLPHPRDEIDLLYQPQAIFHLVLQMQAFLKIHQASAPEEIQLIINAQYSILDHLEQKAAEAVLEAVSNQPTLAQKGLALVEEIARRKGLLYQEESVEQFLERLHNESLEGYQPLRRALYNSDQAMLSMQQSNTDVESLFQKITSHLNSGLAGVLSRLISLNAPDPQWNIGKIGGQAIRQGTFYGRLDIEPETITPETIVLFKILPHNIIQLRKAAAIIVEEGGPLSHAAQISRELKIPLITGAREIIARYKYFKGINIRLTIDDSGNKLESLGADFHNPSPTFRIESPQERRVVQKENAGGKGTQLIKLSALFESLAVPQGIKLRYPPFMILGLDQEIRAFYENPYKDSTLREAILQVMGSSQKIQELIQECPLPFSLITYIEALGDDLIHYPLIARSSAAVEDGSSSFAGLFDSVPNLTSKESLEKGIKQVLYSAFSLEARLYADERNIEYSPFDMGVILQHYIADAEISGVALSRNLKGSPYAVQMQLVQGVGGGVDAQGHPDVVTIDTQQNTILEAFPGEKSLLLPPSQLRKIGMLIHQLEERFNMPVDVEFAIKKDKDNELIVHILQVRGISE